MADHWVTIDGRHVLIKEDGGHDGTHNPATHTGNKTTDNAIKVFTGPNANKKLADWLHENAAKERRITEIKDVTLPGGKILPGRKLTRVVYDTKAGTVRVKSDIGGGQNVNDPVHHTIRVEKV